MNYIFGLKCGVLTNVVKHSFRRTACVFKKYYSTDMNTNVTKDIVLFKYENPNFFRILNIFALCQFSFWGYLSYSMATSLKNIPVPADSSQPWWRKVNLGEAKYKYGLSSICLIIACGILFTSTSYVTRSVKYLILHKGGKRISLITHSVFGSERIITVNLNKVSCEQSRHSSRVQIPLKVSGRWFHYVLDMRGEFTNGKLFDHTAGMKRSLSY